jgi:hypothetical protein
MPEETEVTAIQLHYSQEESRRIRFGFIPPDSDYKWFIHFDGGSLFFHNSWTGYCIFVVEFSDSENGGVTAQTLRINRNKRQHKGADVAGCINTVTTLIRTHLIERVVEEEIRPV